MTTVLLVEYVEARLMIHFSVDKVSLAIVNRPGIGESLCVFVKDVSTYVSIERAEDLHDADELTNALIANIERVLAGRRKNDERSSGEVNA